MLFFSIELDILSQKEGKYQGQKELEACHYLILSVLAFVLLMWSPRSNPFSMHMCMPECPQSNVANNWLLFFSHIFCIGSLLCFHSKSSHSTELDRKEAFCWCARNFIQGLMGGVGNTKGMSIIVYMKSFLQVIDIHFFCGCWVHAQLSLHFYNYCLY